MVGEFNRPLLARRIFLLLFFFCFFLSGRSKHSGVGARTFSLHKMGVQLIMRADPCSSISRLPKTLYKDPDKRALCLKHYIINKRNETKHYDVFINDNW